MILASTTFQRKPENIWDQNLVAAARDFSICCRGGRGNMQDAQHKNWQSALRFVTAHRLPQSTYHSQLGRAEGRHLASCVRDRDVIPTTATQNGLHGADSSTRP